MNTLDPLFATSVGLTYRFEEVQKLDFRVYDIDEYTTHSLDDDDFLGSAETTLGLVSDRHVQVTDGEVCVMTGCDWLPGMTDVT